MSGMRAGGAAGASERFRGRMAATAAAEARLAMELAAFREELYKSREEIASFHPDLDEIENSVRISLNIDRMKRSLPQSRNSTSNSDGNSFI